MGSIVFGWVNKRTPVFVREDGERGGGRWWLMDWQKQREKEMRGDGG